MSEPASPNAQRPKPKRSITFANITTRNNAASRRPDVPRSISFAHPQQQQDRRRPGAPPRALSFCDTRFTPSGPNLALRQGSVSGPLAFLNPTTAIFDICADDDGLPSEATDPEHGGERARVRWNAREFRKGRHVFVLPRAAPLAHRLRTTSRPRRVLLGLLRMATVFPYWDVSWLIGVCFTVGCALFIACGFFYWLPVAYPATAFAHEADVAGGVVAFVGATLFQVGAVLLMLEAWNDRAETKFGGAMETLLADRRFGLRRGGDKEEEEVTRPENGGAPRDTTPRRQPNPFGEREWQWLPSWHDVRTHYVYEIGFLASATMALGAGRDRLLPVRHPGAAGHPPERAGEMGRVLPAVPRRRHPVCARVGAVRARDPAQLVHAAAVQDGLARGRLQPARRRGVDAGRRVWVLRRALVSLPERARAHLGLDCVYVWQCAAVVRGAG